MDNLPTGTVAFLMTDIEGSTRLIGRLGGAYPRLLDEHFALIREALAAEGGILVSSEGDSVFAVFSSARQAISAAAAAQRGFAAHAWPQGADVRVRMGIHVGDAVFGGLGYTGIDVHRTARIMGAGHGGQILVSEAARVLTGRDAGEGVTFRDLGSHALRDLPEPEHIFAVTVAGLASEFPPLRTESMATPTNLPDRLDPFVGRRRELDEIDVLLETDRLVTLTGPGGTGKTRLAIEVARRNLNRFPDGVWFVALDVLRDPALVLPTIAATFALPEQPGRPLAAVLGDYLRPRSLLLVLDNLEQVVQAGRDLIALLNGAPEVRILGTSREALAVGGERVYPVRPLSLPAEPGVPRAADIAELEAVELFVQRARGSRPDFALTDANAAAVAAICRRLDGLPLALELAAARLNVLSAEEVLARLDHRLTLLASSRRDLPARQRTLRGAIDWSHDLLTEAQRVLFRRFSVFGGGATVGAVEAVAEIGTGVDVLDQLADLVERSLLRSEPGPGESRFTMLETIREYAWERLEEAGEETTTRDRHSAYFGDLATSQPSVLTDPRRVEVADDLDCELPNLRVAIEWSTRTGEHTRALEILTSLHDFWHARNHVGEARQALDAVLAASESDGSTVLRARAMRSAAELASWHGDFARAIELAERAVVLAAAAGDLQTQMLAQMSLGWGALFDPARAVTQFEAAVALARSLEDDRGLEASLGGMAVALMALGELDRAQAVSEEGIAITVRMGDEYNRAFAEAGLAMIAAKRGQFATAIRGFQAALRRARAAGADLAISFALEGIAVVAVEHGDARLATTLAAAAEQLRGQSGGGWGMAIMGEEPPLQRAQRALPEADFPAVVAAGQALSQDEVVALALAYDPGPDDRSVGA